MTALIAIYLALGFFSYWPLIWHHQIYDKVGGDRRVWPWLVAWIMWSICWPYGYIQDAWYWWRAKK